MHKILPRWALALACLPICAPANAAPAIAKFPVPGARIPLFPTMGPDGAVWAGVSTGAVIRVTDDGAISTFPLPNSEATAAAITTGPDGDLWFTEIDSKSERSVARLTTAGHVDAFALPAGTRIPIGIAAGSDGNVWFTDDRTRNGDFSGEVGRVTSTGTVVEMPVPASAGEPLLLTAGPDGALWFTAHSQSGNAIVRVTTGFDFSILPLSLGTFDALGIALGADGNFWFTAIDPNTKNGKIGRMTPEGAITLFPIAAPGANPQLIAAGPCSDLWFTSAAGIGRVTLDGKITVFPFSDLRQTEFLSGVAVDANRNVWFSDQVGMAMARVALVGCRALAQVSKETDRKPPKIREGR
ncbi:MAG TPA: virginiamycin B lyase [Thermoanaerobaculia bacterium]|nr:virginiamycin B lyase [Thermoanaerobaculia bacterium]